ncbi:hypothetical protein [Palleronia caenipelagi]|uniref:Uncharacterized protein n=1 Tax=Palleronia caenipelagi TaxID=2489174 RepID=A0A547Q353_9RHOB|nr:hypothetical protein [Palleronia caenipelagi]TRD20824.1 hypothetical protein FEV53_09365 [Palleronia caenipelagi]
MPTYTSLEAFRRDDTLVLKGPVGILLVEDEVEVQSSLDHMVTTGFKTIVLMAPANTSVTLPETVPVHHVEWRKRTSEAVCDAVNAVIEKGPGLWMHYAFNAEYLFFPFSETRRIGEMLTFHTEERRFSMLTYVIDLYGPEATISNAVNREETYLDSTGYYAVARHDPETGGDKDRQMDFFGGLRWRFEEHVPYTKRKIDRIGLFRAKAGLTLRPDHTMSDEEYNTYSCPWHNNLTAAICSFRAAKALTRNAGSRHEINSFHWYGTQPFRWESKQLLELGLVEPGQWF